MSYNLDDGRPYVHSRCGQATVINEEHFEGLCNPLLACSGTICAHCGKAFSLKEFHWADTEETLNKYRSRMLQYGPPFLRHWRAWLSWLVGAVVGALLGYFVFEHKNLPPAGMAAACAFTGLVGVPFLVTPLLCAVMCKTKFYEIP